MALDPEIEKNASITIASKVTREARSQLTLMGRRWPRSIVS
jgi:hypothetical protein